MRGLLTAVLLSGCQRIVVQLDATVPPDAAADFAVAVDAVMPSTDGFVVLRVPPTATDPAISQYTDDNYVMTGGAQSLGDVLLLLPGSTLHASDYQLLLQTAASQGYRAIGLEYPNGWDAAQLNDPADATCTELARLEIVDGVDRTAVVTVSRTDSIEHRLVALLAYLDRAQPMAGWNAYYSGDSPIWSRVAVAGHSFGAGETAALAITRPLLRAVMFSGPNDHCSGDGAPAPWLASAGATPPALQFGLAHLQDPLEPQQLAAWSMLGMAGFGSPSSSVNVDKQPLPYEHAHELKTSALPATSSYGSPPKYVDAHRSTAVDGFTPLDSASGAPYLASAWRYLLGP
jgi:hypothetical protein